MATASQALSATPQIPYPGALWRSAARWMWVIYAVLTIRAVPEWVVDFWFFESIGRAEIFITNLKAQAGLFAAGSALFFAAVYVPVRREVKCRGWRRFGLTAAIWAGTLGGWMLAGNYLEFLLAFAGGRFGSTDPVFGNDIGWYVFRLPALLTAIQYVTAAAIVGCVAALLARGSHAMAAGRLQGSPAAVAGTLIGPALNFMMLTLGLALTAATFLSRYHLLLKDNERAGVRTGAAFLDVTGFFSTLNMIHVSVAVELALVAVIGRLLYRLGKRAEGADVAISFTRAATLAGGLIAVDLMFYAGVLARQHIFVAPNEPTIQIPFIQRHMDATLRGYGLDRIQTVDWKVPEQPVSAARLLESRTLRHAPLLSTWVSSLEEPPDIQHLTRIRTSESNLVYGPLLQVYEQEQQLRPYYRFLSVDGVRYRVGGDRRMFASSVRELPSRAFLGPKEWLRHWGSAALMFTHGMGLVMSDVTQLNSEGGPQYAVEGLPPRAAVPELEAEPRIYIGEGAKDDYILTGIRMLKEFDHVTPQFRKEFVYPDSASDGIRVTSLLRRVMMAWKTGDWTAFVFSQFIDPERTRVHFYRTPIGRTRKLVPFLFLDSNPYAFISDRKILWMVNALTTSDRYPYSFREVLGDKADERAVEKFPERIINYAEDSVKITIDAFTGQPRFYKLANAPLVDAWQRVYPSLFEAGSAMPAGVRNQLTYPLQWFHIQFDDIYKRYHQRDPIEFYNVEDLWDDADEVVGSMGRGLTEFGTTDQMTFSYEGTNMLVDPADLPAGTRASGNDLQYVMLMPFTPEGSPNLRSLVLAYQDPESYGKLVNLRVPQGVFLPGPEQVDTMIDNDSQVNQQITLWVRHGCEVVRGHTLLVPVGGDILYIEPLWISSLQNPLPEIKLFSVVYRGRTTMATNIVDAIRLLDIPEAAEQKQNELPWFNR